MSCSYRALLSGSTLCATACQEWTFMTSTPVQSPALQHNTDHHEHCMQSIHLHFHSPPYISCQLPQSTHVGYVQVRLLLLAGLASEHLLLLGPPGTAKSELSRRLSNLTSGKYYERLLTRFSVPEELFGPLSMRGQSVYEAVYDWPGCKP